MGVRLRFRLRCHLSKRVPCVRYILSGYGDVAPISQLSHRRGDPSRTAIAPPVTHISHASPNWSAPLPRTNSATPSDAASEALREIAWESDRQFA